MDFIHILPIFSQLLNGRLAGDYTGKFPAFAKSDNVSLSWLLITGDPRCLGSWVGCNAEVHPEVHLEVNPLDSQA
jgi:hypothetical protein